jgi:Tetratricopeptide repeat
MDDSRRLYRRALVGYENAVGPDHLSTLGVVNNLGALELTEGNIVEAQSLYERALAGREKALGMEHVKTLNTCQHLATAKKRRGR